MHHFIHVVDHIVSDYAWPNLLRPLAGDALVPGFAAHHLWGFQFIAGQVLGAALERLIAGGVEHTVYSQYLS